MKLSTEAVTRVQRLKVQKEFLVGLLALVAVALMLVFGWLMGVLGPLSSTQTLHILYDFAGGVEVGSPVRVSGVKVGRVETIQFLPVKSDALAPSLRVTISVASKAMPSVREDSSFFINIAGVIGERYIEISPGSATAAALKGGATVRGVDPPRIDQLLSQGYGALGKINDFFERNQKTITEFIEQLQQLMGDTSKLLHKSEGRKLVALLDNLVVITGDVRRFTANMSDKKSEKFFQQLLDLVARAHEIDKKTIKQFFQEEGIRARIF